METSAGSKNIRLRRMSLRDLPEVLKIERLSFSNPWLSSTFEGEIQNIGLSNPIVATDETTDRILGYLIYWIIRDEVQINNIAVHPDYRRRRIAEDMLRGMLDILEEQGIQFISLEVRAGNIAARTLYDKLGFKPIGLRKEYYSNPAEDAVVMGLTFGAVRT
ncbi:MAG: ribosomal protein S18-alanine N-acetyltransferase [Candidatus Aminicenantes bacterium]|nr:ribosomal protein S18-alanine N-acetyltransferase [Candidatus Aminicenantes bacterium]